LPMTKTMPVQGSKGPLIFPVVRSNQKTIENFEFPTLTIFRTGVTFVLATVLSRYGIIRSPAAGHQNFTAKWSEATWGLRSESVGPRGIAFCCQG
jgi:hypothetical protein